ncbi:hypothetical protein D3C87_213130 [compost metagenome]
MGLFFIFIVMAIIRNVNKIVEKNNPVASVPEPNPNHNKLSNYLPFVFHSVIVILILITLFSVKVISDERVDILIGDISFQFYSTLLLVIIGLISPFTTIRPQTRQKMLEFGNQTNNKFIIWLTVDKNLQLTKIGASIIIIIYFIYFEHLKFPALNDSLMSSVAVFLIFFYLLNNIIQLFRHPSQFRRANMFRLTLLFNSIKKSFFVLIGVMVLLFIPSAILGFKFVDNVNPLVFALLGYNVIMAYNEYKILKIEAAS